MRREFKPILYKEMVKNNRIYIICPDLGFGFWDEIRKDFSDRFIQCKATENLALGIGVGMALEGFIPIVYSITPFLLSTPNSFLRNYLNNENIAVKLLGAGRDDDYSKTDAFTHYCGDDKDLLNAFPNIVSYWPELYNLEDNTHRWLYNNSPSYINIKR
jgi:transketolase